MSGWVVVGVSFVAIVRAVDALAHRRQRLRIERAARRWDDARQRIGLATTRALGPLPLDDVLAPCLVASLHVELLLLAALVAHFHQSMAVNVAAWVVAATRMRSLQEVTHYAAHGSLTYRRGIGLAVAAWLFQFPLWRSTIDERVKHHVQEHHPHVNDPARDPNLIEYIQLGFTPPLRWPRLLRLVFYPLTPSGIHATIRSMWANFQETPAAIAASTSMMIAMLAVIGGSRAALFCYVVPLLTLYPLLAWWSQLVEHRWFEPSGGAGGEREYASGRVLDVSAVTRWWLEATVLPFGDSFHLAHSIYPGVRWNHLPLVHRVHMACDRRYREVALDVVWNPACAHSILGDVVRNFSRAGVVNS